MEMKGLFSQEKKAIDEKEREETVEDRILLSRASANYKPKFITGSPLIPGISHLTMDKCDSFSKRIVKSSFLASNCGSI